MIATSLLLLACVAAPMARPARALPNPDSAAVVAAHRAWWRAFTLGDTLRLAALSAPRLSLTMSTGRTLARTEVLDDARRRGDSTGVRVEWSDEAVQLWDGTAVVTSRFTETVGAAVQGYRFITVLRRDAGRWRVAAAQSTRLPPVPARVAVAAELLRDYAGRYRTAQGRMLTIAVRDSTLVIPDPEGHDDRFVPVGRAIFELTEAQARFVFERDATGRVVGLTVLSPRGVMAWTRVP